MSVIVLIPLAAVVANAFSDGLGGFWDSVTGSVALTALGVTLGASAVVAAIGAVMGTLVAWVLVRDEFPGKRLVGALIDLPFALPTIVAGLTLLVLYGPDSPLGVHLAFTRAIVVIALLFVTLPFVVRSVQPVLIELDQEIEEAAASLGASNSTTFRRIVLPALRPAIVSGAALAFARSVGEIGTLVLIAGKVQIASIVIYADIESDATQSAAALSTVLLAISLAILLTLRRYGRGRPLRVSRRTRLSLRVVALAYLMALLVLPLGVVFVKTFEHGIGQAWAWVTTPAAISAFWLTVMIAAIAVPLNTVFGVGCALVLVRGRTRGRSLLDALIDLPFAVSPVIVGLALILVYGQSGSSAGGSRRTGSRSSTRRSE